MHRYIVKMLITGLLFFCSCTKEGTKNKPGNPTGSDYPLHIIDAGDYRVTNFHLDAEAIFSPNIYLHQFYAEERRDITSNKTYLSEPRRDYMYMRSYSKGLYGLRYVGNCGLLDPKKVYRVSGELALFALNDSLLGKPVFEVYELATNKVHQRYIASADSCAVRIYLGAWAPNQIDTAKYRYIYNALADTGIINEIFEGL